MIDVCMIYNTYIIYIFLWNKNFSFTFHSQDIRLLELEFFSPRDMLKRWDFFYQKDIISVKNSWNMSDSTFSFQHPYLMKQTKIMSESFYLTNVAYPVKDTRKNTRGVLKLNFAIFPRYKGAATCHLVIQLVPILPLQYLVRRLTTLWCISRRELILYR